MLNFEFKNYIIKNKDEIDGINWCVNYYYYNNDNMYILCFLYIKF